MSSPIEELRCVISDLTEQVRLAWRKVYPEGVASAWQTNIDASDLHARCEIVPYVKDPAPASPSESKEQP